MNGLFPEIVIDTKDVRLREIFKRLLVQRLAELQIATERLLDDHTSAVRAVHSRKSLDHRREQAWGNCEVVQRGLEDSSVSSSLAK